MQEVLVKTHLIITDIQDNYNIRWIGKILDSKPLFRNNMPVFVIVGTNSRTEINTTDMKRLERRAKEMAIPRGRTALTSATSRIYIVEQNGNEKLLGVVEHNRVKSFSPMYDKVGYIN